VFAEALSQPTKSNLALLKEAGLIAPFYLAGGSAAALYLGHRLSFDLDFFSLQPFAVDDLVSGLSKMGKLKITEHSAHTLLASFNGERVSFFLYQYPLLFPLQSFGGIPLADVRDLACMKLDTISSRGLRRDFIDLYFISREGISLEAVFGLFQKKYAQVNYNLSHLIKGLAYFEDAEKDEMPKMLKPVSWEAVKKFFTEESQRLLQKFARTR
jgi:hypothetical protein